MKKAAFVLGLAFTLAACGGDAEELDAPTEAPVPVIPDEVEAPVVPGEAEADADAAATEQSDASIAAGEIPEQFRGKWDATTGVCSPDSDGRMEVSAKEVSFYESVGDVTQVEEAGDGVTVSLAMEGEGETWTAQYTFTLKDGKLETTTEDGGSFARKRCS